MQEGIKMNKVLLINPPKIKEQDVSRNNYFPLGLLSLATVLNKSKVSEVNLIDINLYCENYMNQYDDDKFREYIETELFKEITEFKPNIIGIGCLFSGMFKPLRVIAEKIKSKFLNLPIVIGGIHPTLFPSQILNKYKYIDYVVIGEGELSFMELVKCNMNPACLKSIDGIAFRSKGKVIVNPKTKYIENLDILPFVDYSLLNVKKYHSPTDDWYSPKKIKIGQLFPVITSRSCPNMCTFCSMWMVHGRGIRVRSPMNVLDEMERLYNDYGVRYFEFVDDNMTFNKKRTLEILNGIVKRKMNMQFDTPNGLNIERLDSEIVDALVNAGLTRISLAVESGSEYIRNKVMRKNIRTDKIYEVFEACAKHSKLYIEAFFVIGMPEETQKTLNETFEMINKLPIDGLGLFFATPYPGTELFNYCVKHKLLTNKVEDYVSIDNLHYNSDKPHFQPHKLTIKDLISFRKMCEDHILKKRVTSGLAKKYPLRYKPDNTEDAEPDKTQKS